MAEHGIGLADRHGGGDEEFVFYGEYGHLIEGPQLPATLTEFQAHLLAELGSGDTLRGILRRHGNSNAYSRCAWHVDRAKKVLGARTVAHAVAIGIRRGWLSEPTGADMRVFPLVNNLPAPREPLSAPEDGIQVEISQEKKVSRFEFDGKPMTGRWGVIPLGWDRPVRHFTVNEDGDLVLPIVLAPGVYVLKRVSGT